MSTPSPVKALDDLRALLRRYLDKEDDQPAIEAVLDVYAVIQSYQLNIAGQASKELGGLAVRALVNLMIGWQVNPFIQRHGVAFTFQVGMSLGATFDGMQYRDSAASARDRGDDDKARELSMRAVACMNEITNVALAAIALHRGVGYARAKSFAFREDMWNLPKE